MKITCRIILMTVFVLMMHTTAVFAAEKEDQIEFGDIGKFGSIYGEEYTNEEGETTNWLTVMPGDRGIRIVNSDNQEIVSIDKFGGIYIKGEVFINGEKVGEEKIGKFTPQNGFIYLMVIVSLGLSAYSIKQSKKNSKF